MKQKLLFKRQFWHSTRIALTILLSFIILDTSLAQERTVTGVITDENGVSIPGVNVILKGTTTGTVSDVDGKYSIKVPGSETILSFSFVGYTNQEIQVGQQSIINVTLKEKTTELDQVVVRGYGVQPKKLVTGATVQVKSEDLERNHVTRIESALQGITPGMTIIKQNGQPGADYNISIRGLGSINGSTPLVLIDGVPGNLNTLNPGDIASVDVLKDAASAAIYGSRGSNGVILITTKKGKKGETTISYDAYYGVSNAAREVPMLNAKQYAQIMNEEQHNEYPTKNLPFTQAFIDTVGVGTDWQKEAYNKNAPSQSHVIGITGGNETSTYSLSLSYSDEEGIIGIENKSNLERMGFRINSEHQLKKYLKVGENLTYTHRYSRMLANGNQYGNVMRDLLAASPLIMPYDTSGYVVGNDYVKDGFGRAIDNPVKGVQVPSDQQDNPLAEMHYKYNGKKKYDDMVGDIYGELSIFKGLKFRTDFGGTLSYTYNSDYLDTFAITPVDYQPLQYVEQDMSRDFNYNFDNVLTYETDFGQHNIMIMVGTNAQDDHYFKMNGFVKGFIFSNEPPTLGNVPTQKNDTAQGDFGAGDSRYSYFGRLDYNFNKKYLAEFSLRRDASSRFGSNYRVGYFPAVSVGWIVSKESFLESISQSLDFFKIRASWGQNGKEPSQSFQYMATVSPSNRYYTFGNSKLTGGSPDKIPNPNLKWEATTQTDIGFDSKFLKDFSFNFDWYNKTSKDWITQITVPGISGIAAISSTLPYINGGNVTNKGVEFELGYNKIIGDFSIEIKANIAYNKNLVTSVPDSIIHGSQAVLYNGSEEFYRVQEGYPVGFFWGYKTAGIFQDSAAVANYTYTNPVSGKTAKIQPWAQPGDVKFMDLNHDGQITAADKVMIGDPNPHYIYGFSLNAAYKGFDFDVNIQGAGGNQIVQCYREQERAYNNYTTEVLGRWTGPQTSNRLPRVTLGDEDNHNWRNFSDLYIHDADYIRVKSISLGYDFKMSLLKNTPIQQFRLYVSAINLLTITKYNGLDPEVGNGSNTYDSAGNLLDVYASGIDIGNYPAARTFMIGLNVKF